MVIGRAGLQAGKGSFTKKPGVKLLAVLVAAVVLSLSLGGATPAAASEPAYDLWVSCGAGYWASYEDYTNRLLSTNTTVGNNGPGTAYLVEVQAATATNGVTSVSSFPIYLGTLEAGDEVTFTLKWHVPVGVTSFVTTISVCADCEGGGDYADNCTPGLVDIKPGSCPNSINLKNNGNVPVAVLSSPTFDATSIDRATVTFAGAAPLAIGKSPQDANNDGLLDLVFHFKTKDLNIAAGDTRACLTGYTYGGALFRDCDSVRVISN